MATHDARKQRALALQERVLGVEPVLPEDPRRLVSEMQNALRIASDEGVLATMPHDVFKLFKTSRESDGKIAIAGGEKDFKRTGQRPCFRRTDGAFFHFTLTVAPRRSKPLALIAYDFELCFPDVARPAFVRFDLNPKDHHNENEGLRTHVHPGTDDFSAPSPLMGPVEILDVLLYDLCIKRPKARG